MKRFISIVLIVFCGLIVLGGCSKDKESKNENSSSTSTVSETISKDEESKSDITSNTSTVLETTSTIQKLAVDASWFDDAVFVGDSITLKLNYYCDSHPEALGNAQFFCAGSLGYTNALWNINQEGNVHPQFQGKTQLAENCAKVTGASKVFVMLGMNDVGFYGSNTALESAKKLISKIRNNSPNATIYVQSVTPILNGKEKGDLTNENIRYFDEILKEYCEKSGYKYFDIYSLFADENGYLTPDYCSDPESMGIHFTDVACEMWIDYLKNNVEGA